MNSTLNIFLLAALYGITMKIADLLDEHDLKLFKGAPILFGIFWGFFGSLLILTNVFVANAVLAMVLAFIVRLRIDYRNHAIATVMIILSFLLFSTLDSLTFFIFLVNFVIFGSITDLMDDHYHRNDWLGKITEFGWFYVLPPFVYGMFTANWSVFYCLTTFLVFYNIVKYLGESPNNKWIRKELPRQ